MAIAHAFRSNSQFINFALTTGEIVKFVGGLFYTTNERIAAELRKVAEDGHPDIYVNKDEPTVDTDALTPEAQMEKRIRAKIMAEMAEATRKDRDLGSYESKVGGGLVTTQSAGQLGNQSGQVTLVPLETQASVMQQEVLTPAAEPSAEELSAANLGEPAQTATLTPLQQKLAELASQKQNQ